MFEAPRQCAMDYLAFRESLENNRHGTIRSLKRNAQRQARQT